MRVGAVAADRGEPGNDGPSGFLRGVGVVVVAAVIGVLLLPSATRAPLDVKTASQTTPTTTSPPTTAPPRSTTTTLATIVPGAATDPRARRQRDGHQEPRGRHEHVPPVEGVFHPDADELDRPGDVDPGVRGVGTGGLGHHGRRGARVDAQRHPAHGRAGAGAEHGGSDRGRRGRPRSRPVGAFWVDHVLDGRHQRLTGAPRPWPTTRRAKDRRLDTNRVGSIPSARWRSCSRPPNRAR